MEVKLQIFYTDGEITEKDFGSLQHCLDHLKAEVIDKDEFVDEIKIKIA